MIDTLTRKSRSFISAILLGIITSASLPAMLVGRSASIPLFSQPQAAQSENACYVSPDQTVVEWKSTYFARCRVRLDSLCVWPIPHKHVTYKVTINDGEALRNHRGYVIAAVNGEEQPSWGTYNAAEWNALEFSPRNRFIDFETIAANEYVVMVQTRYRLFNDVESTLGICIQQP
jgi:hypothetical protein